MGYVIFRKTTRPLGWCSAHQRYLEFCHGRQTLPGPELAGPHVWLRSAWGLFGVLPFSCILDGDTYRPLGEPYLLAWDTYRSDRPGMYSFDDQGASGFVDVGYFHYALQKTALAAGRAPSQPSFAREPATAAAHEFFLLSPRCL